LVPGSTADTKDIIPFIKQIGEELRVIVPQYIHTKVPDYSADAQSMYIKQLIDKIGIEHVHLAAYGYGGAAAIKFYEKYGSMVNSTILISSTGVQEFELLGSYQLNQGIYAVQLGTIWVMHKLLPHFGLLDSFNLNISYARSFYDTDHRPVRSILNSFDKPMLILHGRKDTFVPSANAYEHHRIVPQSELILYDQGHDLLKASGIQISDNIFRFIRSVQHGEGITKQEAGVVRLVQAKLPFDGNNGGQLTGTALIIIMILIVLATLISEDLTCIGAGLMVARGILGFWPAVAACLAGIFFGDILIYVLGRSLGRSAIKKRPIKWFLNEKDLDRTYQWFEAKGPAIIIASRFIPGSRFPTYFTAGALGASFLMFIFYFGIASLVWTPLLVGLSVLIGQELIAYFTLYQDYALWVVIASVFVIAFIFHIVVPLFTYKGRRVLLGRFKRWFNWEFWPFYLLYLPVFWSVVWKWRKYRPGVCAAANPGIEDGGFIGESKSAILDGIKASGFVAAYKFIPAAGDSEQKMEYILEFMKANTLDYPIVLKPDTGERGRGVYIVKSEEELHKILTDLESGYIVQEFVEGIEFGIFYYRFPDEPNGKIYSITEKRLMNLTGDGECTLEELILQHPRAVCLAEYHFDQHSEDLYKVPEKGEKIQLVELGTHARGAVFYDGKEYLTEELSAKIDDIAKSFEGFYFGRFDLKVPSVKAFKAGEDIKILELNGVTSESTHIYHPGYSVFHAWKVLIKQWDLAYQIGQLNANRGCPYPSMYSLLSKLGKRLIR